RRTSSCQPPSDRLLRDVRIEAAGYRPADDGFDLAPGPARRIALTALAEHPAPPTGQAFTPGGRSRARF
ncbi:hypothetical protein NL298_27725, partial [Klebsiella pneumoniae]|nr:hypothetical protein [Klebsiella pneumoniae]